MTFNNLICSYTLIRVSLFQVKCSQCLKGKDSAICFEINFLPGGILALFKFSYSILLSLDSCLAENGYESGTVWRSFTFQKELVKTNHTQHLMQLFALDDYLCWIRKKPKAHWILPVLIVICLATECSFKIVCSSVLLLRPVFLSSLL